MDPKGLKKKVLGLVVALTASLVLLPTLAYSAKNLEIKGFSLGMNVKRAVNNIQKLNIDNYHVTDSGISFGADLGNWLQLNEHNKVDYMLFTYALFDAQDLNLKDFVNKFKHDYHLSLRYDSMRDAYVYQRKGLEVLIPSDPMGIVIIHTVPKSEFSAKG
jgi:hypothetical protein